MKDKWPGVHVERQGSLFTVIVPEIIIDYGVEDMPKWRACRRAWRNGCGPDAAVWNGREDIRRLFASGRYHFAHSHDGPRPYFRKGKHPYGWDECLGALHLKKNGFTCWTGMILFGAMPRKPQRRINTEEIEKRVHACGFDLPRVVQRHVKEPRTRKSWKPKDPDLVAFHDRRKRWRFCEVKRGHESIHPRQIMGLAVLHLLTGGQIAVLRFVPHGSLYEPQVHSTRFWYDGPVAKRRVLPT